MADESVITNPVKAIRKKCLDCMCGNANEVRLCFAKDCALYPFRLGKNPYRAKPEYSEEQKTRMIERLERARAAKHRQIVNDQ